MMHCILWPGLQTVNGLLTFNSDQPISVQELLGIYSLLLDIECVKEPQTCSDRTRLFTWSKYFFASNPIIWSPDNQNIFKL